MGRIVSKSKSNQEAALIPGTYESFLDIQKPLRPDPDSCSLKDLFSNKNTKKRTINGISQPSHAERATRD